MQTTLDNVLKDAESRGLVSAGQGPALARMLSDAGFSTPFAKADEPPAAAQVLEDSEQPRFVRGFHDILITIGILVLLGGVIGILSVFAALPVILLLSEIFVRRQRLALPSVVLSVMFVAVATVGYFALDLSFDASPIVAAGLATLAAGLYHWRYRTPISLAGVYYGITGLLFTAAIVFVFKTTTFETAASTGDPVISIVSAVLALGLFGIAMFYDLSDPARVTRRSDVAFWLHLGAAPLLLRAIIGLFSGGSWGLSSMTEPRTASLVIASVVLLMAVGLVIDRRAFVTSGLISLGVALGTLLNSNLSSLLDVSFSLVAIAIGLIVLSIGLFWQPLRRMLMSILPVQLTRRLPPTH